MGSLVGKINLPSILYFVVFSSKTAFFRLKDIYPECILYSEQSPQIEPLVCLQEENSCHVGNNCMEVLAKRLHVLFEEVCLTSDMIMLYFKKRNVGGLGAGVFDREFQNPQIITMNPHGWNLVKNRGNIYQFDPSQDFFLSGSAPPPEEVEEKSEEHLAE
jgi:hypothetical protein